MARGLTLQPWPVRLGQSDHVHMVSAGDSPGCADQPERRVGKELRQSANYNADHWSNSCVLHYLLLGPERRGSSVGQPPLPPLIINYLLPIVVHRTDKTNA